MAYRYHWYRESIPSIPTAVALIQHKETMLVYREVEGYALSIFLVRRIHNVEIKIRSVISNFNHCYVPCWRLVPIKQPFHNVLNQESICNYIRGNNKKKYMHGLFFKAEVTFTFIWKFHFLERIDILSIPLDNYLPSFLYHATKYFITDSYFFANWVLAGFDG